MLVSESQMEAMRGCAAEEMAWFEELGLSVSVRSDMSALARFLRETPPRMVDPSFDPAGRTLHPDSFWINIMTAERESVASHAVTLFERAELQDLVSSGQLWFDRPPGHWGRLQARFTPLRQAVHGNIAHSGGGLVVPAWRGRGLFAHLVRLSRAFALQRLAFDWFSGSLFDDPAGRMPDSMHVFGFPRATRQRAFAGYFAPLGRDVQIDLMVEPADRVLEGLLAGMATSTA